jgi:hypothetical protein
MMNRHGLAGLLVGARRRAATSALGQVRTQANRRG